MFYKSNQPIFTIYLLAYKSTCQHHIKEKNDKEGHDIKHKFKAYDVKILEQVVACKYVGMIKMRVRSI